MKTLLMIFAFGLMTSAQASAADDLISVCRNRELIVKLSRDPEGMYYSKNGTYYAEVLNAGSGKPEHFQNASGKKVFMSSAASLIRVGNELVKCYKFTSAKLEPATQGPLWTLTVCEDSETAASVALFRSQRVHLTSGLDCSHGLYRRLGKFIR